MSFNKYKITLNDFLNYRLAVMGIATLWIMLFHSGIPAPSFKIFRIIWYFLIGFGGGLGVNLFLFASGIGLIISFKKNREYKNKNYIYQFYKRRIIRILPTYIFVSFLFYLIKYTNIFDFMYNISLLSFWMEGVKDFWYIAAILILYFLFPIYAKATSKIGDNKTMLIALAFAYALEIFFLTYSPQIYTNIEVFLTRIPVFIFGCYFGSQIFSHSTKNVYDFLKVTMILSLLMCFGLVLGYLHFNLRFQRYLFSIFTPILYVFLSYFVKWFIKSNCKFLEYFGQRSLEFYLIHVTFGLILQKIIMTQTGKFSLGLIVYFLSSIILSEFLYMLMNKNGILHLALKKNK